MNRLPDHIARRLRLPLISAPMLRISGPDLVIGASRAGVIGAFPVVNAGGLDRLDEWLGRMRSELDPLTTAPFCPNLVIRHSSLDDHVRLLVEHGVEMVITSVGSPAPVVDRLHEIGCFVLADVNSLDHAEKAVAAGADGLVCLSAGAGGQTGQMNGMAFVRAVRRFYDGPLALAGGIADGVALHAAEVLGADLGYMGTRFIATTESLASTSYREMLVDSSLDDVLLTSAFTGLPTSILAPAVRRAGLDPNNLDETVTEEIAAEMYSPRSNQTGPRRWTDIFSAGHSVSAVDRITTVAELVSEVEHQYRASRGHESGPNGPALADTTVVPATPTTNQLNKEPADHA